MVYDTDSATGLAAHRGNLTVSARLCVHIPAPTINESERRELRRGRPGRRSRYNASERSAPRTGRRAGHGRPAMSKDLRSFLDELGDRLLRVRREVDPLTQLG